MVWSRPENRAHAGKLLVVGGNAFGFVAPAEAFRLAEQAGIGAVQMLLPDSMRRYVGKVFDAGEFAITTPSGSFSQKALGEMLPMAAWGDGVLLAGDFGRNSETAILLEKFAIKYSGQLTLSGDSVDYFLTTPAAVLTRPDTLIALTFGQLQKLAVGAHFDRAFTSQLDLLHFVAMLHDFSVSAGVSAHLLVRHAGQTFVAVGGKVSSTPYPVADDNDDDILPVAVPAAVWWLQNPGRPYVAITAALAA